MSTVRLPNFTGGLGYAIYTKSKFCKLTCKIQTRILHVFDPTALHHIILKDSHAYDETKWFYEYVRSSFPEPRALLTECGRGNNLLFGPGLLSTHGMVKFDSVESLN